MMAFFHDFNPILLLSSGMPAGALTPKTRLWASSILKAGGALSTFRLWRLHGACALPYSWSIPATKVMCALHMELASGNQAADATGWEKLWSKLSLKADEGKGVLNCCGNKACDLWILRFCKANERMIVPSLFN